jgi:AcrR family transcriptional regulator
VPKRSQAYRDARREQILSAAKSCFVRNGFHETSMQDIFAEAGLSAGAVYRYFASKGEVIGAIALENMGEVRSVLHALAADPQERSVGATLAAVLELVRAKAVDDAFGPVALLVWAEVLRDPELHREFTASLRTMRADLAKVVEQRQLDGALPATVSADSIAGLIFAIVPGSILQLTLLGDTALAEIGDAALALWPDRSS